MERRSESITDEERSLPLALPRRRRRSTTLHRDATTPEDDTATRELLHLVADGEVATLGWLRAYHAGLARPADRRA
jgi:hypothetical protein